MSKSKAQLIEINKQQFIDENTRLIVLLLEQSTDELISQLSNFDDYKDEFQLIKTEKRKREFLGVRIAMNILTGNNVIIDYDANQKPYLSNHTFRISISHSRDYIAVIAGPDTDVGIDIECRTEKVSKVYKRFLNEEEQTGFYRENDTSLLEIAWSAKETLYKIIGKEAQDFARHLHLYPFTQEAHGEIKAVQTTNLKIYNLKYIQNNKFTLVYCVDKN